MGAEGSEKSSSRDDRVFRDVREVTRASGGYESYQAAGKRETRTVAASTRDDSERSSGGEISSGKSASPKISPLLVCSRVTVRGRVTSRDGPECRLVQLEGLLTRILTSN